MHSIPCLLRNMDWTSVGISSAFRFVSAYGPIEHLQTNTCISRICSSVFCSFQWSTRLLKFNLSPLRISETVERHPYTSGRYYVGIANHFIRFPRMATERNWMPLASVVKCWNRWGWDRRVITWSIPEVNSVLFSDDDTGAKQGPALQSRTRDGLNVRLEAFCCWNHTSIEEQVWNHFSWQHMDTICAKFSSGFIRNHPILALFLEILSLLRRSRSNIAWSSRRSFIFTPPWVKTMSRASAPNELNGC